MAIQGCRYEASIHISLKFVAVHYQKTSQSNTEIRNI